MPLGNVDALSDDDAAVGGAAQLAQVPDSVQVKPSDAAVVPAAKRQLPGDRTGPWLLARDFGVPDRKATCHGQTWQDHGNQPSNMEI